MQVPPEQLTRPAHPHEAQSLRMTSRRAGPVHSLRLFGELDLASSDEVEAALLRAERGDARLIVLDLSGVMFMDSTGVRIVLTAEVRSRRDANRLRVRRGRPSIQRVFEICGVEPLLPFVD